MLAQRYFCLPPFVRTKRGILNKSHNFCMVPLQTDFLACVLSAMINALSITPRSSPTRSTTFVDNNRGSFIQPHKLWLKQNVFDDLTILSTRVDFTNLGHTFEDAVASNVVSVAKHTFVDATSAEITEWKGWDPLVVLFDTPMKHDPSSASSEVTLPWSLFVDGVSTNIILCKWIHPLDIFLIPLQSMYRSSKHLNQTILAWNSCNLRTWTNS